METNFQNKKKKAKQQAPSNYLAKQQAPSNYLAKQQAPSNHFYISDFSNYLAKQ